MLEIYRDRSLIARLEFDGVPALRTAIVENRGRMFIVRVPEGATGADRTALLDLRAQGYDIAVEPPV